MTSVLVIDDAKVLLEEIVDFLTFEGFEVYSASDGLQGLEIAHEQLPDVILCDINMPGMDGYEVLEELRSDSMTSNIPFIFLTAKSKLTDMRIGMNLGADDYLSKPFDNVDLLNAIRTRLERKSTYELTQLRSFSHQLVTLQEAERQKLALQLQNDLINMLSGLRIILGMVDRLPPEAQNATLNDMINIVDELTSRLNDMADSLSPPTISYLGLLPALLWYVDKFTSKTKIQIHFQHAGLGQNFDPNLRIMVYRIIQEALTNIYQHAQIHEAWLQVWVEDNRLSLQIRDEGVGFDIENALHQMSHTGLTGIREQANLMKADLTIRSTPKLGTQIIAHFPLEQQDVRPLQPPPPKILEQFSRLRGKPVKSQEATVRVVVVEENEAVRWGIRKLLEGDMRFQLSGEALNSAEAHTLIETTAPDIVILSLTLPDDNGLELARELHLQYHHLPMIILSNFSDRAYVDSAFQSGALGYILKSSTTTELIQALLMVSSGKRYISQQIITRLPEEEKSDSLQSDEQLDALSTLTNREREVLHLVLDGMTNAQIAEKLVISPRTAETHRFNMMRKLGLKGSAALMRYAVDKGLIG